MDALSAAHFQQDQALLALWIRQSMTPGIKDPEHTVDSRQPNYVQRRREARLFTRLAFEARLSTSWGVSPSAVIGHRCVLSSEVNRRGS